MKRLIIIILSILISISLYSQAKKMNVVDYYRLFQDTGDEFQMNFSNVNIKSNNIEFEEPEYGSIKGIVDEKNYYISTERLSGDGKNINVFAIYLTSDGNNVVGYTTYDNVTSGKYRYIFLQYVNEMWKDVTKEVIPSIENDVFFDYKYDLTSYEKIAEDNPHFKLQTVIEIPREGTVTKYSLFMPPYKTGQGKLEAGDIKIIDEMFSKMKYKYIELIWNYNKGIFEFGKKIPK